MERMKKEHAASLLNLKSATGKRTIRIEGAELDLAERKGKKRKRSRRGARSTYLKALGSEEISLSHFSSWCNSRNKPDRVRCTRDVWPSLHPFPCPAFSDFTLFQPMRSSSSTSILF